jgi:hypothetical protein
MPHSANTLATSGTMTFTLKLLSSRMCKSLDLT